MASSNIVLSSLLIISLTLGARSERFLEVKCQKSDIVAQYGTDTLLDCDVKSNNKQAKSELNIVLVSWKFNESTLVELHEGQVKVHKSGFQFASPMTASSRKVSLLITNTNLDHAGEYECLVVANHGHDTARVNLVVESKFSKPQIRSVPDKIIRDKSFTLTCESNGYPQGDIRWVVDGSSWKSNPKLEVKQTPQGLYNLKSTLPLTSNSEFSKFVCEVYNAKGVKEDHEEFKLDESFYGRSQGNDQNKKADTSVQIVAPLVVIGSLIIGLLVVLVLRLKRRRQARRLSAVPLMSEVPAPDPDESYKMVPEP